MRTSGAGVALVAATLVLAGCAPPPPPPQPPAALSQPGALAPAVPDASDAAQRAQAPAPGQCTATIRTPEQAESALSAVRPGATLCFTGTELVDSDLVVETSGSLGLPITLLGNTTVVRSVSVAADHVTVDGFTTYDGDGLVLEGDSITARGNTVLDAKDDGISCEGCVDARLERNVVERADGTGILVEGDWISVRDNVISSSVRREADDADGIRFFGRGHVLAGNTIRDITDDGYPEPAHADCFQTYDTGRRPTVDVEIAGNRCVNVDHQCLVATAEESGRNGSVGRSRSIRFHHNLCEVRGSQAVLIRWFPHVDVRDNEFRGTSLYRGISILDKSVNGTVLDNTFRSDVPMVELDDSSQSGFTSDGNTTR